MEHICYYTQPGHQTNLCLLNTAENWSTSKSSKVHLPIDWLRVGSQNKYNGCDGMHRYITVYELVCVFSTFLHVFLRRPRVDSRALGCGARWGGACTPRRKFGSRAGSVARALGVQSREIWQVIAGSLSAELHTPYVLSTNARL